MSDPLLSRRQLQEALEHLAERLHRRGVHAEVYVFGGGAMVLGHNAREATMDLDAAIRRGHGAVTTEAQVVARELGLPGWWLNEQAAAYLPAASDDEARTVLAMPGLTVIAASARHLLAMKARAARQRDVADIITLARLVGASSAEQVIRLAEQVFGGEPLSDRSTAVLADLDDTLGAG
ncbi:MAG: hypothetical protein ACR2KK_12895 [Acidimicrobiales bacterium]